MEWIKRSHAKSEDILYFPCFGPQKSRNFAFKDIKGLDIQISEFKHISLKHIKGFNILKIKNMIKKFDDFQN